MAKCKKEVYRSEGNWTRRYPCSREAVRDGWCKQHHPDAQAARDKASSAKYNAESAYSHYLFEHKRLRLAIADAVLEHGHASDKVQSFIATFRTLEANKPNAISLPRWRRG